MDIGVTLRNMGEQSHPSMLLECARAAVDHGFESIWITDHIAIPPDDAEGSGGRYLDTLTTLAWLAGAVPEINVGSGVLILPYRPMLPTAKQIASVQELSQGRLLLGVGVGWMDAEFRVLGVPRRQRGALTDETLDFLADCFAGDVVEANGQAFIFKPRPERPPILVGGRGPHAWRRAVERGDGLLPMARDADSIVDELKGYRELVKLTPKARSHVSVMTRAPKTREEIDAFRALEIDRLICSIPYTDPTEFIRGLVHLKQITHL